MARWLMQQIQTQFEILNEGATRNYRIGAERIGRLKLPTESEDQYGERRVGDSILGGAGLAE